MPDSSDDHRSPRRQPEAPHHKPQPPLTFLQGAESYPRPPILIETSHPFQQKNIAYDPRPAPSRSLFTHSLPQSVNSGFHDPHRAQKIGIPLEILERGSYLHTARSNFPTKYLPPLGVQPYTTDGIYGRRMFSPGNQDEASGITEINWDWGVRNLDNPYIQIGQEVEVRELLQDEKIWSPWERATVVAKGFQRTFLAAEFTWYRVQLKGKSRIREVSPFVGEIWDGGGGCPVQTPHHACSLVSRLRTVFVSGFIKDTQTRQRKTVWLPAKIISNTCDPDVTVEFFEDAKASTGFTGTFKAGRVLPYTQRTASMLRSMGEFVGPISNVLPSTLAKLSGCLATAPDANMFALDLYFFFDEFAEAATSGQYRTSII